MDRDPQLVEAGRRAAARVWERLDRYGRAGEPGFCLVTAALFVAEVRREGYDALIQAGAGYWRRVADPADPAPMFGYAYDPDHPTSVAIMAGGGMPEFHAWACVPGVPVGGLAGLSPGSYESGMVVDLSARWFPRLARMVGLPWTAPEPGEFPHVWCGEENWASHAYVPSPEACQFAALMVRYQACKLIRQGHEECHDLFEPNGGPARPQHLGGDRLLDYSERLPNPRAALGVVREVTRQVTGREHVPFSTAVGTGR